MPNALASSVFLTGAKDKLATADVYTLATDNPINSIQAITIATNPVLAVGLTGSKGVSSLLSGLLSTAKSAVPGLNLTSAAARVSISLPSLGSAMNLLSSGAQNSILSGVGSTVGGAISSVSGAVGAVTSAASSVTAIVNGVSQAVTGAISDVAAIGSLISGNACNDTFALKDTAATVGALSGVIGVAMNAGIPNAFKALTCGVSDTTTMNGVIGNLLPSAISSGDLGTLTAMATSASPGLMTSLNPNVLGDFSACYAVPSGNNVATLTNGATIATTFDTISPGWDTTTDLTNGTSFDVTAIQSASPDFQQAYCSTALATAPVIDMSNPLAAVTSTTSQQSALLASSMPSMDPMAALNAQYPSTVADTNQIITSASVASNVALSPTTTTIPSTTTVNTQTLQSGLSTSTVTTTTTGGGSTLTTYPPSSDGQVDSLPASLQDPTPLQGANGDSVCMTAELSAATATYGPEVTNYPNGIVFSATTYVFSDKSEVIVTTRTVNGVPSTGATNQYIDSNQNTIRTSGGYGSDYGGATATSSNT